MTDILLDGLAAAYLIFLGWHFYVVVQRGSITVGEPNIWILCGELYVLVPLLDLFGLWKLLEDIILYARKQRGAWRMISEIILGIAFLAAMVFITYHFLHIWSDGQSRIASEYPWIIIGAIAFGALLSIYKTWEDFKDLREFGKLKNG